MTGFGFEIPEISTLSISNVCWATTTPFFHLTKVISLPGANLAYRPELRRILTRFPTCSKSGGGVSAPLFLSSSKADSGSGFTNAGSADAGLSSAAGGAGARLVLTYQSDRFLLFSTSSMLLKIG